MKYRKFLVRLIIFSLILIALDFFNGRVLEYLFYKQKTGADYQLTYSLTKAKQDILIFGNSRAQTHYNDSIISNKLNMSCYNAGLTGGYSIFLPSFQINQVLKRYHPKVIIYEFSPYSLGYWNGDYERLSVLMPYIDKYPETKALVFLRGRYEELKIASQSYRYNSKIYQIILYNLFEKRFKNVKGFMPINNEKFDSKIVEINPFSQYKEIDTNKVAMLKKTIAICKKNKIKLIFVNSPFYHKNQIAKTDAYKEAMRILEENKVPFIDLSSNHLYMSRPDLFANQLHLNSEGANFFSEAISKIITNNY